MGAMRITQGVMVDRVLNDIQSQTRRLLALQDQLATGRRIVTASDDPIDARQAMDLRTQIAQLEQYTENINMARPRLRDTETTMMTLNDRLQRLRELTLQAANGTNDQVALDNIAEEVNQILEDLVSQGNAQSGGVYVFGGTRTRTEPFVATRDANGRITAVTYEGNDEDIEFAVSATTNLKVNETGADVFQGVQDIFQTVIGLRDDMLANNQNNLNTVRIDELDAVREQVVRSIARVGAVQNRLDRIEQDLADFQVGLESLLSQTIDADYAEVIVELNAQNNAYQAALQAGARVIQPSLLDFIR